MRKWTIKILEANLQKRFGDRCLRVKERAGQIQIYRVPEQEKHREMIILKVTSMASRDYILKRMYEMDTQSATMATCELDGDKTEDRIYKREQKTREKHWKKQQHDAWVTRRKRGNFIL